MDLAAHAQMMARNNAWSNYRLYEACRTLSPEEFHAARTGFFPSLHATLNHILAVDCYYIDALDGGKLGPSAFQEYKAHDDVASLAAAQAASDRRLMALCDRETAQSIQAMIATDRGAAGMVEEARVNLLSHLFLHQTHHRGQAHAMLSGTGVKPPQLDEYLLDFDRGLRANDLAALGLEGPEAFR
jgi:uncharacterized damage-inducible protein DinB